MFIDAIFCQILVQLPLVSNVVSIVTQKAVISERKSFVRVQRLHSIHMASSSLSGVGDEVQAGILRKAKTLTTLPIDDETSLIQEFARDAFAEIKKNLLESNIQPTIWSVLAFLLTRKEDSPFSVSSIVVDSGHFGFVIEHAFGNEYDSVFIKELLSCIFQEMAVAKVDIAMLRDNALDVRVPSNPVYFANPKFCNFALFL
jgi:hypothetical protein